MQTTLKKTLKRRLIVIEMCFAFVLAVAANSAENFLAALSLSAATVATFSSIHFEEQLEPLYPLL